MKIAISGASGFLGSHLVPFLEDQHHIVHRMVRSKSSCQEAEIFWNPATDFIQGELLENLDAVIHLSGENIASGRWNESKKKKIRESRVQSTALLSQTLAKLQNPPRLLLTASAIGYYGDRGDEILTESSPPGQGFLSQVCRDWESATRPAQERGLQVVHLRFGSILSRGGGVLEKMLIPFRLGLGGVIGSGQQWMSWVSMLDMQRIIQFILNRSVSPSPLTGPLNAVAPEPVIQKEWTRILSEVLRRPTLFRVPAKILQGLFGEMANELFLSSTRVLPQRLTQEGFEFQHSQLEPALRQILT